MTKSNEQLKPARPRPVRKSTIWTRDKIGQLIELYKRADCLWNYHIESYKSKEARNKAIEHICTALSITKYDYGKKIHNLRNQFNSEMKKLERRVEEFGGTLNDDDLSANGGGMSGESSQSGKRCRWEHFESLMFLRQVIEPRPGYQPSALEPTCKKFRTKLEYEEDIANSHAVNGSLDHVSFANSETSSTTCQYEDSKQAPTTVHLTTSAFNYNDGRPDYTQPGTPQHSPYTTVTLTTATVPTAPRLVQKVDADAAVLNTNSTSNSNNATMMTSTSMETSVNSQPATVQIVGTAETNPIHLPPNSCRDQWDAFGEMIANEFRNLNSELSRKKLKRKIMQAMLEVGDEDDSRLSMN